MPLKDFSPDEAVLLSALGVSVLYGIDVVVFSCCVYVLLKRGSKGGANSWMLLALAIAQFIVSSLHIGDVWHQTIVGFLFTTDTPHGASAYFITDPNNAGNTMQKCLLVICSFLADAVLIWRVYIVWGRRPWICIPPIFTTLVYLSVYFTGIGKLNPSASGTNPLAGVVPWLTAGLSLSVATNIILTGLIAGRIWWTYRNNIGSDYASGSSNYMLVIWTMLDSGAVYTMTEIVTIAFLGPLIGGFLSNLFIQVAGIVPTLIIVRVSLRQQVANSHEVSLPISYRQRGRNISNGVSSATEVESYAVDVFASRSTKNN
ncbi:hypothetical protein GALMADRAFT_136159 [Galerina marginata CBS 339.88]|uniref:Uncharacterized protein n=1 Tax=Galerina marginata (strain CBS 339.88) TaxID=685588 RepID=A0A067TD78_GALM3|nr:hypothetical protein GALMADRAFT_136159 [Galerina marginata CBS 339.88]